MGYLKKQNERERERERERENERNESFAMPLLCFQM